ncbi:hypothetical protein [Streptomyces sp. SM11]|nr:hypothetical protein [Streptomyces sp. SM11]
MRAVTRDPLAGPGLLGVDAGVPARVVPVGVTTAVLGGEYPG